MDTIPFDKMYPSSFRGRHPLPQPGERDLQLARVAGLTALPRVMVWSEKDSEGRYPVLLNSVTWRVAQTLGIEAVPVEVFNGTREEARTLADLEYGTSDAVTRAKTLIAEYDDGAGLTPTELAQKHEMDRTLVWHLLALRFLDDVLWSLLEQNKIAIGHARLLARLPGETQRTHAKQVVDQKLSVRQLRDRLKGAASSSPATTETDPNVARLEQQISETLGAPVKLRTKGPRGELVIEYESLEILDGILERLGVVEL